MLHANNNVRNEECMRCGEQAHVQMTEILPDGGIIEVAIHNNTYCKWVVYDGYQNTFKRIPRSKQAVHIICPKCRKEGRVGYHTLGKKGEGVNKVNIINIDYYVDHKDKRCQGFNQYQRDILLKQLKRYISTPMLK